VIDPGTSLLKIGQILSEVQYQNLINRYGEETFFANMGAEALKDLLKDMESGPNNKGEGFEFLSRQLRNELYFTTSQVRKKKIIKRLRIVEAFKNSDNKPEWMLLEVLPVIPPDLRPLVPLDGGRFATSDLNDLYRRVINRNNRLRRLKELHAPEIILKNEKRMLQEAVDALFDNGKKGKLIINSSKRPLKSLSDMLKGKYGRFRQNLLGKRVDYSGRSVIVAGPKLLLHQCGIPKSMAVELFKPFIYKKLSEKGYSNTIKSSRNLVKQKTEEVWKILDEIAREHPVILNRAPTLHRLGIQSFEPILIDGKAIQLHPLVCTAFNADFDGDQMAVHIPLSVEAQLESRILMMSSNNILSPANGQPILIPTQDIVLGTYFMTRVLPFSKGENIKFVSKDDAIYAYKTNFVGLQSIIFCKINKRIYKTTVGRIIFYEKIPQNISFEFVNQIMGKHELIELIDRCYRINGLNQASELSDYIKSVGYEFATRSGISISLSHMLIPKNKSKIIDQCEIEIESITEQYTDGFITDNERYNNVIAIWSRVVEKIANCMIEVISKEKYLSCYSADNILLGSFNALYIMANSGAKGSSQQLKQLTGMRGLMARPSGDIIETPIIANFKEGLSVLQYFISVHGTRKGLADTALKTANSGYLTRRLVDVAHDSIIMEYDCKTTEGLFFNVSDLENKEDLNSKLLGRTSLNSIVDPSTNFIIVNKNSEINEESIRIIQKITSLRIGIKSALTCKTEYGICAKCYGRDLSKGSLVNVGEAVGVVAAQSIGEPGTQLTMRTFHVGGIASNSATDSYYRTKNKGFAVFYNLRVVRRKDNLLVAISKRGLIFVLDKNHVEQESYNIIYGSTIFVNHLQAVTSGTLLAEWDSFSNPILTDIEGVVHFQDLVERFTFSKQFDEYTGFSHKVVTESKNKTLKPCILVKSPVQSALYTMPVGAILVVNHNANVCSGDIIAKFNKETIKTKDITGGLPKIVELFEARCPKHPALIAEINGIVLFKTDSKGKKRIIVNSQKGFFKNYTMLKDENLCVKTGDFVKTGETLVEGSLNPHDILRVFGEEYLSKYLTNEIQSVYKLQGVHVNDKHIEIIIKQMLKRVIIKNPGNTAFLIDEHIEKKHYHNENKHVKILGGSRAYAKSLLLGITEASLATSSFISSASFQETTRVLTDAAVFNKIDYLRGLKENVIMGRLIPAGTGFLKYRNSSGRNKKSSNKTNKHFNHLLTLLKNNNN
jgi:DNA-directed RNA polymerase subunit beta'